VTPRSTAPGHLAWPFFTDAHRKFALDLEAWAADHLAPLVASESDDVDATFREIVHRLGAAGWLRYVVPQPYGLAPMRLDVRTICLGRETLGQLSGMADFRVRHAGARVGPDLAVRQRRAQAALPASRRRGDAIAAFALSEPTAGSDVSAMETTARRDGSDYVLDGRKTWISNAGIAAFYVVFARLEGDEKQFVALVVDADNPGLTVSERIAVNAPHPLGTWTWKGVAFRPARSSASRARACAWRSARWTSFRSTVGAASLGFARRALSEATSHALSRRAFGQRLADFQLTQAKLAEMALAVDASALLVYRAAWTRDAGAERVTREAAMAKLYATEAAQRVIDDAVQLFGGRGVVVGETVERLYRGNPRAAHLRGHERDPEAGHCRTDHRRG
jgi:acyl-CoA dehydrogenase